ncbi:interleukin-1 receptor accessory protein isoform X1 [Nycticebus coucang]|uniref:interleukin-1 receptor accessory protein isoform X1 n=2 Tax=Nycticebus coucang TaxID=9470 RepID=UPI00234CDB25|nr:interleukin-1 receptor accessory protein isoform X1 [Nycticebus coucang]XP_053420922.1 interleukin-1 receptor accessory protein isoform X1 [Nycticebus coucang]XP_053420923.1 interleukin-1 receptor accessory protein isoform X1 [Nycticebus coucang]XP_053420924.1 interleukin-1 receptor accessory protein isoform X1 [Nycticebus coucang]XP_053420925.1 interleukin-1 receptor accessory protein isoform X1 [Nycticebus coucang]XP_053420926.1 interleukin-1 receptor accessory protein isoform X1 [Nyctice
MTLLWFLMSLYFNGILQSDASERCDDWGLDTMRQIQVFEDEPARIKCPLFEHFLKYNYSTAHSAGLTLIWYWTRQDRDLEEPINFRLPENRISKEKDVLWFRPTLLNDTGNYTCMLRNTTYCSKVAFPLEVVQKGNCFNSPMKLPVHRLYIEHGIQNITCPNVDGYFPSTVKPTITWYMGCSKIQNFNNVVPEGRNLSFLIALISNNGNYTCVVTYPENGRIFHLTRTLTVKVVGSPKDAMPPQIHSPNDHVVYEKEPGEELLIPCKVYFSFLKDSHNEVWWTIDGKKPDDITADVTINESISLTRTEDETRTQILSIKKVTPEDLKRTYVCHARNGKGEVEKAAKVKQKVVAPRYTVELACGFGATVLLVVVLIIVYHVYWLEMVLFYRAHFGTDETILDGKEYDIYVSYARNAEEEEFVLLTLRGVLENEFGYKLCIFDRDSLPGGNTVEAVFDFIQRSRRMIVVLSPDYVTEKSISMLEFKLGVMCQNAIATKIIVVEYRPLEHPHPGILQLKESVSFVSWKGEKSKHPGSKFWKALRLALPLRSLSASSGWNESCSSQSDISLDHVQRRRSRLKEPPELQSSGRAAGSPPAPGTLSKPRGKPSAACHCCVTYCEGESHLRNKSRAELHNQPQWETHLCKPVPQESETQWIQNGTRLEPPAPQISALALHHFTDLSNNNDFYIL